MKPRKLPGAEKESEQNFPLSQNVSKKSKLQSFYSKGIPKITSLQEALSTMDEEDESVRNVTVLPLESGDRNIPTDEEDNFEDNASFPTEVVGELKVHYNSTNEVEEEKVDSTNFHPKI